MKVSCAVIVSLGAFLVHCPMIALKNPYVRLPAKYSTSKNSSYPWDTHAKFQLASLATVPLADVHPVGPWPLISILSAS